METDYGLIMAAQRHLQDVRSQWRAKSPPFRFNLLVSGGLFKVAYRELVPAVLPLIAVSLVALALVAYVPTITVFIHSTAYGGAW